MTKEALRQIAELLDAKLSPINQCLDQLESETQRNGVLLEELKEPLIKSRLRLAHILPTAARHLRCKNAREYIKYLLRFLLCIHRTSVAMLCTRFNQSFLNKKVQLSFEGISDNAEAIKRLPLLELKKDNLSDRVFSLQAAHMMSLNK